MPTGNGDAKLFDDYRFDVLRYKRGSNPGGSSLPCPRRISGLTGRARQHTRVAGDLEPFSVEEELEPFLEYLKTKMGARVTLCITGIHLPDARSDFKLR